MESIIGGGICIKHVVASLWECCVHLLLSTFLKKSSNVVFIAKYKRGYPVLFGLIHRDVVAAAFPGFVPTGSLGGAQQRLYC